MSATSETQLSWIARRTASWSSSTNGRIARPGVIDQKIHDDLRPLQLPPASGSGRPVARGEVGGDDRRGQPGVRALELVRQSVQALLASRDQREVDPRLASWRANCSPIPPLAPVTSAQPPERMTSATSTDSWQESPRLVAWSRLRCSPADIHIAARCRIRAFPLVVWMRGGHPDRSGTKETRHAAVPRSRIRPA